MTEDEIRDLLHEMRDEPIPADSLARVRLGVAERTQARRIPGFWKIAAMLLATGCLALVSLWLRPAAPIPAPAPPVVVLRHDPPPTAPAPPVQRVRQVVRRAPKPSRRIERAPIAGGAVLIRIETPDPDVVILLLGGD